MEAGAGAQQRWEQTHVHTQTHVHPHLQGRGALARLLSGRAPQAAISLGLELKGWLGCGVGDGLLRVGTVWWGKRGGRGSLESKEERRRRWSTAWAFAFGVACSWLLRTERHLSGLSADRASRALNSISFPSPFLLTSITRAFTVVGMGGVSSGGKALALPGRARAGAAF